MALKAILAVLAVVSCYGVYGERAMTSATAAALVTIYNVQTLFTSLTSLGLTDYKYPTTATVSDGDCFDFIIVGGGTAGCVLANRLSANGTYSILVIEAGKVPPLQAAYTGLFPVTPLSEIDWDYNTTDNGYTAQYTKNNIISMTAGKMLGGSSGLNHAIMVNGTIGDYALWAEAANDSAWNYTNLQPYVAKITNLYGNPDSKGNLKLTKEPKAENNPYIKSFIEMGYSYTNSSDANQNGGVEDPLLTVYDSWRQSTADAYITPILNRTNLKIMYESRVIKINFDSSNKTTGVQVIDSSGNDVTICVNKEVILTAGAVGSAHILLLSGVGPADDLEAYNISVVSDLPVGKVMRDHPSASVCFATETANVSTTPINYGEFPLPALCSYKKDSDESLKSEYQSIPILIPSQSSALLELCGQVFKYDDDVCDAMYAASESRNVWYLVQNLLHPVSAGNLTLQSANYTVQPKIHHGIYSNTTDLVKMAAYLQDFYNDIMNTSYFLSVGAELVDLGLSECANYSKTSNEYWQCYALAMSGTMWHYTSTCQMGTVVDNELKVKGVSGLRVGDASAMPSLTSGNIQIPVMVIAEKLADLIISAVTS